MKKFVFIFLLLFPNSAFSMVACDSYEATYKPHPDGSAHDDMTLTISQFIPENGSLLEAYDILKFKKNSEDPQESYELIMKYKCSEGSAPSCSLGVGTSQGQAIEITPAALHEDFSPAYFVARNNLDGETAPYIMLLPGATSEFYYKGRYISEESLTFANPDHKAIFSFPPVWIFKGCRK
ncbi:MAG: hypothetical protein JKY71_03770 [Alphaproteobacteria bacterium]|nr:hypothetical protein [Alphaproteobacteria bacterium]